jgi:threonine synthase
MNYHSIANHANKVSFQQAVINGLAPDGSLYVPEIIPQLPESFIRELPNLPLNEVAYRVARKFVDASVIKDDSLFNIVSETLNFPFPLVTLNANTHILELFHGPTLAFKDVGARFLARVLRHVAHSLQREITVLVATSGDTGGAVASGFYKVEGINVVILYPSGLVSKLLRWDITFMH